MQIERWGITVLELFLTALFLIFDFSFGWQYSHSVTCILATVAVAGAIVIVLPHPHRIAAGLAAFVVGIATLCLLPAMPLAETTARRWLVPSNDKTPPNACSAHPQPRDALTILVGDGAAVWTDRYSRKGHPLTIMRVGKCDLLSFNVTSQGLRVNADIFTPQGLLAARIRDNELYRISRRISYTESWGDDGSTLAVYDRNGGEMLWVRNLNPDTIKVRGVFTCPGYPSVVVTDYAIRAPGSRISTPCIIGSFTNIEVLPPW
jgi:hypothetical protein